MTALKTAASLVYDRETAIEAIAGRPVTEVQQFLKMESPAARSLVGFLEGEKWEAHCFQPTNTEIEDARAALGQVVPGKPQTTEPQTNASVSTLTESEPIEQQVQQAAFDCMTFLASEPTKADVESMHHLWMGLFGARLTQQIYRKADKLTRQASANISAVLTL